ncbi:TrlF family AAA-like ATPase [Idiomarina sp.]|uniref:TrlF family AAA-like ATPase n=1 Tax=Idiomarina sp. TaxID=1874361 RepID=UPI0025BFCCB7|nr:PHP domain-containing protein [Idiomarina sp.]NQZ04244.1 histidinol-phosphatase [Idiomarina sp.]
MTAGAQFHRGDLHIHSYGEDGSYDVTDETMTPENIIEEALQKNISIISITDHNRIRNSIKAVQLSRNEDLLVLPGIEISTTQGHLLSYFSSTSELENFYGKLVFDQQRKFCTQGLYDCLELVDKYNGIGILAHIEVESGFEKTIGKFNQIFDQAFQHPAILALEIKKHESINRYTEDDDNSDRKSAMKRRNLALNLPEAHKLAKIISSDAHSMRAFGKNAAGADRITRFKLDELSFKSLKVALLSHDSRIRLEDEIPLATPRFKELTARGGILDGMNIQLSNNMNCIIGGRGTGKSTLLTAIQETSNNPVENTTIQKSRAWPSSFELKYENEAGQNFTLLLEHGNVSCLDEKDQSVEMKVDIEAYTQGFTTFSNCSSQEEKDEKLLQFFDGFTNVHHLKNQDQSKIIQLISNYDTLQKLVDEVSQKSEVDESLQQLEEKQNAYEQQNVGELMKLHSGLVAEEHLRKELEGSLAELKKRYQSVLSEKEDINSLLNIDKTKVRVGKEHVDNVLDIVRKFSDIVERHQQELNKELEQTLALLRSEVQQWRGKETTAKEEIEAIKKQLDDAKVPYDEDKYVKLSQDIARLKARKKDIEKSEKKLNQAKAERQQLLKQRIQLNKQIHSKRLAFCTRINTDLSESVDGLFVSAKVGDSFLSKEFSKYIKDQMGWHRWAPSDKIASAISPLDFYNNMKFKKYDFLRALGFEQPEIEAISGTLTTLRLEQLISLPFEERPKLTVTRYSAENGNADVRDISELSLGQQQSIMLSILIHSDSCLPLIIDQPEDNLDSEFIFNSVVTNLRKCKEKRQIIVVTHNSNIGVLGDAELVIPLMASSDKSSVVDAGSIDNSDTQKRCCEILEGGEVAFTTRKDVYGI